MKKIILFLGFILILSGCSKTSNDDLIDEFSHKISNVKNYQMTALLEITRNEEKFTYDVISTYKKGDYFKVELINKANNHQQIILRDQKSVYVLTPSLNKSFKFQSEWPYNNSQIYLLQPIIADVENDRDRVIEKADSKYIITSKVNYSSEKTFIKQKIYFDEQKNITKVEVLDNNDNVKMQLSIIAIEYDIELAEDTFNINKYQKNYDNDGKEMDESDNDSVEKTVDEIVYPMYVPSDTYLTGQDVIDTKIGERVILTFTGESNFMLIQENLDEINAMNYVYGDPHIIIDTVGSITDYSVSWISNDIEYSVISDTMSIDELLTVAQSISVEPVGK